MTRRAWRWLRNGSSPLRHDVVALLQLLVGVALLLAAMVGLAALGGAPRGCACGPYPAPVASASAVPP